VSSPLRESSGDGPNRSGTRRAGEPIVSVENLTKTYSGWLLRRSQVKALRGVTLQAHAGDVFGLLGPNGAGKTTLIKILLGVVRPSGGAASLFGRGVGVSATRLRVGYLPESLRIDRHHTARSALRLYGRLSRMSSADIRRRSDELLDLVGLRGRDSESVRRFSKGMYQRLGLAQALMHDPDLLVLDEPTDGLDPVGRNEVRRVIDRLRNSGKTIFLNSHILQEVELVCTRVAILADGQIRGIGTLDEIVDAIKSDQIEIELLAHPETADAIGLLSKLTAGMQAEVSTPPDFPAEAGEATFKIILADARQSQIDRLIDRLRQLEFSIIRLQRKRVTLEDAFMQLVNSTDAPSPTGQHS